MRINLITPFAEKEAVKALGARWDSAKKHWYITDVSDLTPFARWIPDLNAATEVSADGATRLKKRTPEAQLQQSKAPTTKSTIEVPHCGCKVLPWEDCIHSATL